MAEETTRIALQDEDTAKDKDPSEDMTTITIEMNTGLKEDAEALFEEFGMDLQTAFHVFVRQTLREGRIPFEIGLYPPKEEVKKVSHEEKHSTEDADLDLDELFAEMMNED